MRLLFILTILCTCGLAHVPLLANGIQITNLQRVGDDGNNGTDFIFTVSWENSWRLTSGPANYDAAYIFAKFRENGGPWRTMSLDGIVNPGGGATLERAPSPSRGIFVYRDGPGAGDFSTRLQIQWLFENQGVDGASDVEVKFFALEMVYVPEGAYDLGDGTTDNGGFYRGEGEFPEPPFFPYRVASENAVFMGISTFTHNGGSNAGETFGQIRAAYPKGFGAFYAMKYEVSQQQWVDFFNTLDPSQQAELDITGSDGKNTDATVDRNAISWDGQSPATTALPDVPVNYLPKEYDLAYLDWAGLRPLTELEYEKASRGPRSAVAGEYAWGNTSLHAASYALSNAGTPIETVSNPGTNTGNAAYSITASGNPLRVGIFAASATNTTRQETGGSYYGIMELSGNLFERYISVGSAAHRDFTGVAGNGVLTAGGRADAPNWPTDGYSYRGGSYGGP
ncbi:MAG: SUMF1/EgtB/PvdO family nonheme iron enzyme, partial [Bacteroidota bacterium]